MTKRLALLFCVLLWSCALATDTAAAPRASSSTSTAPATTDVFLMLETPQTLGTRKDFLNYLAPFPSPVLTATAADGSVFRAACRKDGSCVLRALPAGSYHIGVRWEQLAFGPLLLDVLSVSKGKAAAAPSFRMTLKLNDASQLVLPGFGDTPQNPLMIPTPGRYNLFVPREQVSILGMFKNPMVIMMVVTAGLVGLMKLVPQEELKKQMKELQQETAAATAAVKGGK